MNDILTQFMEGHYVEFLAFAVVSYFFLWVIKNVLISTLRKISQKTTSYIDDLIVDTIYCTRQYFIMALALFLGSKVLSLGPDTVGIINKTMLFVGAFQVISWGKAFINGWMKLTLRKRNYDPAAKMSLDFVGILAKFGFISIVILFMLNNMGVDVTTFVTGLGIGGVAIALATQRILGDLFSSLSIVMDKPFVVGDPVNVAPDISGQIEQVGLKTTRIKSTTGEQIIISNSDLLAARIRNFKRMEERRVAFFLGVSYGSSREKLKLLPGLFEELIKSHPSTRFDRVHLVRFGTSSLDFEIVYFMTVPDYLVFADTHQAILYGIMEILETQGVELARPAQHLMIQA